MEDSNKYKGFEHFKPSEVLPKLTRIIPEQKPELQKYTPKFNELINPENAKKVGKFLAKHGGNGLEIVGFIIVSVGTGIFGLILLIVSSFSSKGKVPFDKSNKEPPLRSNFNVNVDVTVNINEKE